MTTKNNKVNGQKKGKSFERDVSKEFQSIFGIQFRPTPGSGAYVGGQNRGSFDREDVTEAFSGDLLAGDANFPFCVEAKNYADEPKFHQMLQGESKTFDEWVRQAEVDAEEINKHPLLVFKIKRKGIYVAVKKDNILKSFDEPMMFYGDYMIMSMDSFKLLIEKHKKHWGLLQEEDNAA